MKIAVLGATGLLGHHTARAVKAAGHHSEDEIETLKTEIQDLLKKYEGEVDKRVEEKTKEVLEV